MQKKTLSELCYADLIRQARSYVQLAKPKAHSPMDIAEALLPLVIDLKQETLYVIPLSANLEAEAIEEIHRGTLNSCMVHPRDVFRTALEHNALGIVMVHNHPCGDPQPSEADIAVTHRIFAAGFILGIPLVDSLVIAAPHRKGREYYVSLRETGLLEPETGEMPYENVK